MEETFSKGECDKNGAGFCFGEHNGTINIAAKRKINNDPSNGIVDDRKSRRRLLQASRLSDNDLVRELMLQTAKLLRYDFH